MTELVRGFRGKLGDILDVSQPFTVKMHTAGNAVYDTCCFGVDTEGKLSDDRYMVFYNQTSSPAGEITFGESGGVSEYTVSLGALPQTVAKLVFTVSIDGDGTMGQIASHTISIFQNGEEKARLTLGGGDFSAEKAIIGAEIYLKSVWRIAVVASGFNGGLADLLASYGGEAAESEPAAAPTPAPAPQFVQPEPVRQSIPQPVQQPAQPQFVQPEPMQQQFVQPQAQQPIQPQPAPTVQPQNSRPATRGAELFRRPAAPEYGSGSFNIETVTLSQAMMSLHIGLKPADYDTRPLSPVPPVPRISPYNYETVYVNR